MTIIPIPNGDRAVLRVSPARTAVPSAPHRCSAIARSPEDHAHG